MKRIFLAFMMFYCISFIDTTQLSSKTIYVKSDATGLNNGTSWSDAFKLVQNALDNSISGDQIWVTAGTYYPTKKVGGTGERFRTYQMKNGVKIYGGFIGNETLLSSRDWKTNETILSGNIGNINDSADNSYHVFYHPHGLNLDTTAIIDGFKVMDGNANDVEPHNYGGGLFNEYNNPTIINCKISNNSAESGGGIYNYASLPNISNCQIENNTAIDYGGGIYNVYSISNIINSKISSNNSIYIGGGIYNYYGSSLITNCTISDNFGGGIYNNNYNGTILNSKVTNNTYSGSFGGIGGGISNYNCNLIINFCNITNNSTTGSGGGICSNQGSPTIKNCIISSNIAIGGGGGIYATKMTLNNCIITDNIVLNGSGGGIYGFSDKNTIITNCTISNNSSLNGNAGGIYCSSPHIYNSILWGNKAYIDGNEIYCIDGEKLLIRNSCFSNNTNDIRGTLDKYNCINIEPKFLGNDFIYPYSLASVSPCLDAGDNSDNTQTTDIRGSGFDRKLNKNNGNAGTIDIGAYEFKYGIDPILIPKLIITLNQGWNMISSNIIPQADSVQYVFSDIKNNLVIAKNNDGDVYIPSFDINDIGKWDRTQGYQVYMTNADTLKITGFAVNPSETQIVLNESWNMISYLRNSEMDCETAFAGLTDDDNLVIVKDNEGNVYIPSFGINTIGNLVPGQGYQIYVLNEDMLTYPGNLSVIIGEQVWMTKNLDVDHYRNGDTIPQVTDPTVWSNLTTGAWCYYNNDPAMGDVYCKLYNWYAINDPRGLAPFGWHIPTDLEWKTLEIYLGMTQAQADATGYRGSDQGGKMKETGLTHWSNPNEGATNSSGFSALPGGVRGISGNYYGIGLGSIWWSISEYNSTDAWYRGLGFDLPDIYRYYEVKKAGFNVRCVKD
jgi:uncharacterized protein (TIGR02145 family)